MRGWSPGDMVTERVRLVQRLAEGGMGEVWVADHLTLQTRVAVKFMADRLVGNDQLVERFAREARAAAQLRNPHVVSIMDFGVTQGTPFILMELCDGQSLRSRLDRDGRLGMAELLPLLRQLANAVEAAHALGIVHRDIKPENLFLVPLQGSVFLKVLDFGIVRLSGSMLTRESDGATIGTLAYMSPEQLFTPAAVGPKSDVWSAAVVAYEALTGTLPFPAGSLTSLLTAIETCNFVPSATLPNNLVPIFQRAFARDETLRFSSITELTTTLDRAWQSGPVVVSSVAPSRPSLAHEPTMVAAAPAASAPTIVSPATAAAAPIAEATTRTRNPLVGVVILLATLLAVCAGVAIWWWTKPTTTTRRHIDDDDDDDDDDRRTTVGGRNRDDEVCAHVMKIADEGKLTRSECDKELGKVKSECAPRSIDAVYDCLMTKTVEKDLRSCKAFCERIRK